MKQHKSTIFVASLSALFGTFVGVSLTIWARIPDHTIDLLAFTESMFGIGLALLAAVEGLRIFNLQGRIEKLEEQAKKILEETQSLYAVTQMHSAQIGDVAKTADQAYRETQPGFLQTLQEHREAQQQVQNGGSTTSTP